MTDKPTNPPPASAQAAPPIEPPTQPEAELDFAGAGPSRTSHREIVRLPVGFELPNGELASEAEVRAVTGADELFIGMSSQYNRNPNDLVYKTLLY